MKYRDVYYFPSPYECYFLLFNFMGPYHLAANKLKDIKYKYYNLLSLKEIKITISILVALFDIYKICTPRGE